MNFDHVQCNSTEIFKRIALFSQTDSYFILVKHVALKGKINSVLEIVVLFSHFLSIIFLNFIFVFCFYFFVFV